ncbi:cytotoxic T-lymphocyte protein 4 [Lampris incognitus]|uniref:cytotoxic T-lymphocyte protein 4 n=1 Tax=Lampris incognitus TaxID=2546036 RepID=UPI0024B56BDB|nr:cytotoxic T-lymphocyte protein 4 [Lampris incognitus]
MMVWILLTALYLCMPAWSALKVTQPYRIVSSNGTARLQCFIHPLPWPHSLHPDQPLPQPSYPYSEPKELRVSLVKGLHHYQELCSSLLIIADQEEGEAEKTGAVQCHAEQKEGTVELTVSGLRAEDTDIYVCVVEILYPPPYLRITGNGTLIHVLESPACPVSETQRQRTDWDGDDGEDDDGEDGAAVGHLPLSVPVIVLVTLVVFVLGLIILFQILHHRQGRRTTVRMVPEMPHKMEAAVFAYGNIEDVKECMTGHHSP